MAQKGVNVRGCGTESHTQGWAGLVSGECYVSLRVTLTFVNFEFNLKFTCISHTTLQPFSHGSHVSSHRRLLSWSLVRSRAETIIDDGRNQDSPPRCRSAGSRSAFAGNSIVLPRREHKRTSRLRRSSPHRLSDPIDVHATPKPAGHEITALADALAERAPAADRCEPARRRARPFCWSQRRRRPRGRGWLRSGWTARRCWELQGRTRIGARPDEPAEAGTANRRVAPRSPPSALDGGALCSIVSGPFLLVVYRARRRNPSTATRATLHATSRHDRLLTSSSTAAADAGGGEHGIPFSIPRWIKGRRGGGGRYTEGALAGPEPRCLGRGDQGAYLSLRDAACGDRGPELMPM